jgi:hypothetical protein
MKKSLFFIGVISLLIVGCKSNSPGGDNIKIENKFNKNIICVLGYNYPNLSLDFINKKALQAKTELHDSYVMSSEIEVGTTKVIDTLGLCNKEIWNKTIKHSMLMLFVFDKEKLFGTNTVPAVGKIEDALIGRYYFTYDQVMKTKGVITVDASKNNL